MAKQIDSGSVRKPPARTYAFTEGAQDRIPIKEAPAWLDTGAPPSRGPYSKGGYTEPAAPDYTSRYGIGGAPVFNPQAPQRVGGPAMAGPAIKKPPAWLDAQPSQMARNYGAGGMTGYLGGGRVPALSVPQTRALRVAADGSSIPSGSFIGGGGAYVQGPDGLPVPLAPERTQEQPRKFGDQADSPYWPLMIPEGGGSNGGGFGTNYGWGGGGGGYGRGYSGYGDGGYPSPAWLADMGLFQLNWHG